MADLGRKTFIFTWRIENFSMCHYPHERCIESPTFVVDFLENTKWKLRMYPNKETERYYFTIYLEETEDDEYAQEITIDYSLEALSTQDGKNFKKEMKSITVKSGNDGGFDNFYALENIFENENGLLPNDTFTLRCCLGTPVEQQKNKDVLQYPNTDTLNSKLSFGWYEGRARTRVKVSHTSFVWSIERFAELACDEKVSTSMAHVVENEHSFDVSLKLVEDSEGDPNIRIEIRNVYLDWLRVFARCHIRAVGVPRKDQFQGKGEFYFGDISLKINDIEEVEEEVWIIPTFLKIKHLRKNYLNHTNGTLHLRFDLSFSIEHDVVHYENITERFPLHIKEKEIPYSSACNFEKLYENGEFVDITLRVDDREFKVHKLVLVAESKVFHRMFESRMKEENSGIVDIDDLDSDTVERLLKYVYSHHLEEMSPEDSRKLYSAADKYDIDQLKCQLRTLLITVLSRNTVYETLILSDTHQDEDLKAAVVDYICRNCNEIFHSEKWKNLTDAHARLAASTMLQVFRKK